MTNNVNFALSDPVSHDTKNFFVELNRSVFVTSQIGKNTRGYNYFSLYFDCLRQ